MNKTTILVSLHAHFPLFDPEDYQLESYFFAQLSDRYLPLLSRIKKHSFKEPITIAFSPSCLELLTNARLMKRYFLYLEKKLALTKKESANAQLVQEKTIYSFHRTNVEELLAMYSECKGQFIRFLQECVETGRLVAISSTAAYLPFIQSEEGVQMQLELSINTFEKHFGFRPKGFWSPYGVYSRELDKLLSKQGIAYTFVNEQVVSESITSSGETKSVISPEGVLLLPTTKKWSDIITGENGYQLAEHYLDPVSDIAYERKWEELAPFSIWEDFRAPTGLRLKQNGTKPNQPYLYELEAVHNCITKQAHHFLSELERRGKGSILSLNLSLNEGCRDWLEMPDFLNEMMNQATFMSSIEWITPEKLIEKRDVFPHHAPYLHKEWMGTGNQEAVICEKEMFRELVKMEQKIIAAYSCQLESDSIREYTKSWLFANDILLFQKAKQWMGKSFSNHINCFYKALNNEKHAKSTNDFAFLPILIQPDVFYSEKNPHNHWIQVEKKARKQHILMLSWEFPPSVVGGLGKHVWEMSRALSRKGHMVCVLTPSFVGAPSYEKLDNIHVYRVKESWETLIDFHQYVARFNLNMVELAIDIHRQWNFDLVHAHDWMVGLAARCIKTELSLPLITTIHALEKGRRQGEPMSSLQKKTHHQEKQLMLDSDKIIVCSSYMEEIARREYGLEKERVSIIPNGVEEFPEEGGSDTIQLLLGKYEYDHLILSFGRMVPEKGFETLIQAAATLLHAYPKCLFIIGGKGPLLADYRKQVENIGLGRSIVFPGFLHDHEKQSLLHQCGMFIVPSLYEPFGIVALEGMMAKKPVIASKTGGLASIIEEEHSGLLFEPGNVQQLIENMQRLIENPQVGKRLGQNAKRRVKQKYAWEDVRRKTEAIYDSTITTSSVQ